MASIQGRPVPLHPHPFPYITEWLRQSQRAPCSENTAEGVDQWAGQLPLHSYSGTQVPMNAVIPPLRLAYGEQTSGCGTLDESPKENWGSPVMGPEGSSFRTLVFLTDTTNIMRVPKKKSRKVDLGLNLLLYPAPEGELAVPGQILRLENHQGRECRGPWKQRTWLWREPCSQPAQAALPTSVFCHKPFPSTCICLARTSRHAS